MMEIGAVSEMSDDNSIFTRLITQVAFLFSVLCTNCASGRRNVLPTTRVATKFDEVYTRNSWANLILRRVDRLLYTKPRLTFINVQHRLKICLVHCLRISTFFITETNNKNFQYSRKRGYLFIYCV
jgi:hypothetical protein